MEPAAAFYIRDDSRDRERNRRPRWQAAHPNEARYRDLQYCLQCGSTGRSPFWCLVPEPIVWPPSEYR
jgi:hypothetical protein